MSEQEEQNSQAESVVTPAEALPPLREIADEELANLVFALLFTHGGILTLDKIAEISGRSEEAVRVAVLELKERLTNSELGIELDEVNQGLQLRTHASFGEHIRRLKAIKPRRLSPPALETLAIVAYRQPIVKSDIEMIRGVDCTPTLKTLLERRLIKIVGRQATVGQPALYGTSDEFLELFGLSSLAELPTLRELRDLNIQDDGPAVDEVEIEEEEVVNQ